MKDSTKNQATRLSEYVDSIITRSRAEEMGPCDNDPSLRELAHLAADLSDLRLVMPETLHRKVCRRLFHAADTPETKDHFLFLRAVAKLNWRPVIMHLPLGLVCALFLVLAVWFWRAIPVSAATVLARSETALANLVGPDEVLHRRWAVRAESTCVTAGNPAVRTGIIDEWLQTKGQVRSAGRSTRLDGTLRWAYSTGGPQNRHIVYFPPSPSYPRGLLSVEPTTEEYYAAVQKFPAKRQPVIRAYLDRGYVVEPILSDQRFNWRALTDQTNHVDELPRVMLTMTQGNQTHGEPYYRIGIAEDRRPWFWWSAEGKPSVWLEHQETVSFISASTYLSWRIESNREDNEGCLMTTVRNLVADERVSGSGPASDVFSLTVPPGTPVRQQSATDLLNAILAALDRITQGSRRALDQ